MTGAGQRAPTVSAIRPMRDPAVRASRLARRYEAHVAPINRDIVDELRKQPGNEGTPYTDPEAGGVDAELLFLLRDPGPKAAGNVSSSGLLSWDNDDDTAELCAEQFERAGIPWRAAVPWNVVPWPRATIRDSDWRAGRAVLARLLAVSPRLKCVMPLGIEVAREWALLAQTDAHAASLVVFRGPHPSRRGLTFAQDGTRQTLLDGVTQLEEAFDRAAGLLGYADRPRPATGSRRDGP